MPAADSARPAAAAAVCQFTPDPWSTQAIVAGHGRYLMPSYKNAPIVFARGEGPWNLDQDGRRYLDFSAGVAVNGLGHNHPDLVAAVAGQAGRIIHQSNYWHNEHAVPLAADLCGRFERAALSAAGVELQARAFFCNSGAEGTEAAVKLVRRYHSRVRNQPRPVIVTVKGSFHGRTYAAMSATAQPKYQDGFDPLVPGFRYAEFGQLDSIAAQLDGSVGAVFIEVVQGEGGVCVPPPGFFKALRHLCDQRGVLLGLDEVQTGLGRTGTLFAFEQEGIAPDLLWLAKALGGGIPIGAVLARDEVAQALQPGTHATTFGANALVTYVGRVVLGVLDRDDLVGNARRMGDYLMGQLRTRLGNHPRVQDIRGRGLMCGVQLQGDVQAVIAQCRTRGLLVSLAGADVVRMTPPLVIDRGHIDFAVEQLAAALG
ncbi:MAG: acetylornithine/succinylornithine family transaminase [Deltaproteobacteria bacterium]|nr:acetylornithine/succinylornithine family transaminase [Deltaproteobacteria bacterium]